MRRIAVEIRAFRRRSRIGSYSLASISVIGSRISETKTTQVETRLAAPGEGVGQPSIMFDTAAPELARAQETGQAPSLPVNCEGRLPGGAEHQRGLVRVPAGMRGAPRVRSLDTWGLEMSRLKHSRPESSSIPPRPLCPLWLNLRSLGASAVQSPYSVRLNNGVATASAAAPKIARYTRSGTIAHSDTSFSSRPLKPSTAKLNGSMRAMKRSHEGKAWIG